MDNRGYIIVTDTVKADGVTDVSDAIQALIDANPNRTLFFPDGVYRLGKPIATPADPTKSVDLQLSNYAVLQASEDWSSEEAMVRLGGEHPYNSITINGSNYSLTGGIVDGNGVADGISIDSGRETAIRRVSIKHTRVGIHIKRGANSNSSDADIADVNIVGNGARDSIGVLIEGFDNTLNNMRIANVCIGVKLHSAGNVMKNIHPLFTVSYDFYDDTVAFWDCLGNNWYNFCYSDQFRVGFRTAVNGSCTYDSCYAFWYSAKGGKHTLFKADGSFDSVVNSIFADFVHEDVVNTVLEETTPNGRGYFQNIRVNEKLLADKNDPFRNYLQGKIVG